MKKEDIKNFIKAGGAAIAKLSLGAKLLTALCLTVALSLLIEQNYAWHSDNKKVSQLDVSIGSDTTDLSLTGYSFYYGELVYDEDGNVAGATGTRSDASGVQTMNPYDAVIGNNQYTPVYYRICLSGSRFAGETKLPIVLTVGRSNGQVLPTDDLGHYYTETQAEHHWNEGKTALYLSNIVGVSWGQINIATNSTADVVYNALQAASVSWHGADADNPHSFITPIPEAKGRLTELSDDAVKTQSITLNITDYDKIMVDGVPSVELFLRIDYCQPLVEVYLNQNYASLSGRLNQKITESFEADITSISIN